MNGLCLVMLMLLNSRYSSCKSQLPLPSGEMRHTPFQDVCLPGGERRAEPPITLQSYAALAIGLNRISLATRNRRIGLASTTKSFLKTHYSRIKLSQAHTETTVLVDNGLTYRLYDNKKDVWAANPFQNLTLCNTQLPSTNPYAPLQKSIDSTESTPNSVIAKQYLCDNSVGLHEFVAFGTMRSGRYIQWLNICREIRTRTLSFHKEEVYLLLTRTAWQVGSISLHGVLEWHIDLNSPPFSRKLLTELDTLLNEVKSSWMEAAAVRSITVLCARVLAATESLDVMDQACCLLRAARKVAYDWMKSLLSEEHFESDEGTNDRQAQNIRQLTTDERLTKVCEMALTCRSTYDVDQRHLIRLLSTPDDLAVFVECSIQNFNNTPPSSLGYPEHMKRLLQRDIRLAHGVECRLSTLIHNNRLGIDQAVSSVWPTYRPGQGSWFFMKSPHERWAVSSTESTEDSQTHMVHVDVLTGRLLIDGKNWSRLPSEMTGHRTFKRIFGSRVLEVVPSGMPGFEFMTAKAISGYQIHFLLRKQELVIRAVHSERSESLELIPNYVLVDDFPTELVQDYVHWLDLKQRRIEFRPLRSLWEPSSWEWVLTMNTDGPLMSDRQSNKLVDVHCTAFRMIAGQFSKLEQSHQTIVTCTITSGKWHLSISLPRFRLGFFVSRTGILESVNYPGFYVDTDQTIGTFFGLVNYLVMKPSIPNQPRRLLIPSGAIVFVRNGDIASVSIQVPTSLRQIRFYEYHIRTDLGFLEGDGSLGSHFHRAYLHALTSHCLPDPLTRRTGTEESLSLLRSSRSFSFQSLQEVDFSLINQIMSLTPRRFFYPVHLEVMQTVHWSALPYLAQHPQFRLEVEAIVDYCRRFQELQVDHEPPSFLSESKSGTTMIKLMTRDHHRNSRFYVSVDLEARRSSTLRDAKYHSRDEDLSNEPVVYRVASLGFQPVTSFPTLSLWSVLSKCSKMYGSEKAIVQRTCLSYTSDSLNSDFLLSRWLSLYDSCRDTSIPTVQKIYQVCFCLPAHAYANPGGLDLISALFYILHNPNDFLSSPPPSTTGTYNLIDGAKPTTARLAQILEGIVCRDSKRADEKKKALIRRQNDCREAIPQIANALLSQWPGSARAPQLGTVKLFPSNFLKDIQDLFNNCTRNHGLFLHIQAVQTMLPRLSTSGTSIGNAFPHGYLFKPVQPTFRGDLPLGSGVSEQLLLRPPPHIHLHFTSLQSLLRPSRQAEVSLSRDIQSLTRKLTKSSHRIQQLFGTELAQSSQALLSRQASQHAHILADQDELRLSLEEHHRKCWSTCQSVWEEIYAALGSPRTAQDRILSNSGLWPTLTPLSTLRLLSFDQRSRLIDGQWKETLHSFAKTMVEYQKSRRLFHLVCHGDFDRLLKEMENDCTAGLDDLDWLLVQITGDFLARDIQVSFAKEMINPSNKANSVLQLNMGEGKSSVIVPMIASSLPNGQNLVRIVVLKALSAQMFQLLVDRISGLPNRRIFYLPFSRDLKVTSSTLDKIQSLFRECMETRGVLIAQPEHILSYRLMGIDRILHGSGLTRQLTDSYRWLSSHSRDILDESDEILHNRYQLVYTIGKQKHLEEHPNRWTTIQDLFSLLLSHILVVMNAFPKGVRLQYHGNAGGPVFPVISITQIEALLVLLDSVVSDVLNGRISSYPFERLPLYIKEVARSFITEKDVNDSQVALLSAYCGGTTLWNGLLLLRGLVAHGILAYCLQMRRWRVDYGLDERRTLLAVPYRAKDVPSLRSDFSHPDVVICLTCLAYYYRGLTSSQVETSLEFLLKSDNPTIEYERWIRGVQEVPQSVTAINLRDSTQFSQILVPHFSHNRFVIDFYLSQVVFPKYALDFPEKLMTSGWDLTEIEQNFVTGFSGTKDTHHLLPATITQCDPLDQESTTAQVIEYLLQQENNVYQCVQGISGERLTASEFLRLVVRQSPEIRVLLDVGAQILDLGNEGVAQLWLELNKSAEAAVFFDEYDCMMVMDRQGSTERLFSSQYRNQLGRCVVYLDDAHTRGTDLKLPRSYRAAVTLGAKVTKDRLTQGCMRMRQLGKGQSVMFLASYEVDQKIRRIADLDDNASVTSFHVLTWTYTETVADVERYIPHWLGQGVDYMKRKAAWDHFSVSGRVGDLSVWKQPEARTLQQMYGTNRKENQEIVDDLQQDEFLELRERCRLLGWDISQNTMSISVDEEQEREVSVEIEKEQHVEKPSPREPADHQVSIESFIQTGIIPKRYVLSPGMQVPPRDATSVFPLFSVLPIPGLRLREQWCKGLVCTIDFARTVKDLPSIGEDMRPVTWIISGGYFANRTPILVVISPFEANELRSAIEKNTVGLHLHVYAPKLTQNQLSFEDLRFLAAPPLPLTWTPPNPLMMLQLNLFAGQLYLKDWETYKLLCLFLGLHLPDEQSESMEDRAIQYYESDGFVKPDHRSEKMRLLCPFKASPLSDLKTLYGFRRKGSGYAFTHMGRILAGRSLERKDFD
ncbi:hypothetical protein D9758_013920 [Tetrapyrgos nigripes]|uniref:ubiquitinyl hydrolase 1 n=1 Tax=Tetrapyrgos nigripes TaxID=182062 RepID=A0A8H5FPQ6_9AGAR|nr:hypothetical protein D9758_013920 [Tetrapyrgos nigripes]